MTRSLSRSEILALAAACESQVAALAAAGKVKVCKENESGRDPFAGYTERRMRDAENLGTSDIQSERMMLHGFIKE